MLLRPIGTPLDPDFQGDILSKIMLLKQESRRVYQEFLDWADVCSNYFHYGRSSPDLSVEGEITVNDIQNAVITQTDIQTKEPPTITLEPVDTGEPPKYYANIDAATAQALGLQPNEYGPSIGPDGSAQPPTELSYPSLLKMQQAIAQQQIPPTSIEEVSITETTEVIQKIFDVIWRRSSATEWYWENVLLDNVYGWQPSLYEFDDKNKKHIFTNLPLKQVFIDPTASTIEKASYVIVDMFYDAEVAKGLYPELAEEIEEYAQASGKVDRPPETLEMGSQVEDVGNFNRPTVILTIAWLKDQPCYMPTDQAIQEGAVTQQKVGTNNWTHSPDPDNPGMTNMVEETRDQYTHAGTGAELLPPEHDDFDPEEHDWPTYRCTRQITAVANRSAVLADEESAYGVDGIPVCLNQNIPVLGKPVGIGEPFRLRGMQDGRTRLLNAIVDHSAWFKAPMTWSPLSARDKLPEGFEDGHMEPGTHLWIPDDLIAQTKGNVMGSIDPPTMPPSLPETDDKLKREINDSSGNMAAIQGQAPEQQSQLSGVAIGLIQSGAASLASFKAHRIQTVVERKANLSLHSILTRTTAADWGKIIKKYRPHVLEAMHAQGSSLEWTINVQVAAGAGQMLSQKKAEAKDNFTKGLISRKTCQERINEDPRQEDQRMQQELQEQLQNQARMQPPAGAAGNGPPAAAAG